MNEIDTTSLPKKLQQVKKREQITELIESNLFPGQEVTTEEAYELCRHLATYAVVSEMFRAVCGSLVEEGRAKKIVNGRYLILKHK